jgi:hypothetical protein
MATLPEANLFWLVRIVEVCSEQHETNLNSNAVT